MFSPVSVCLFTPGRRRGIAISGQDGVGGENQNSIACTCCAAGGMPLAFTQEDFLVLTLI